MNKIIDFLKKNEIYPIYIVVKKIYKSKNKYFYQFNENGYAVAISLDKSRISKNLLQSLEKLIKKNKLKLNLCKTDKKFVKIKKNNNNLFLSLYKKMIVNQNELSR